jgi:hypothetical protein
VVRVFALLVVSVFVMGSAAACVAKGQFVCTLDGQCGTAGTCEANGACSFPDPSCTDSERRFGAYAGDVSETCVSAAMCGQKCGGGEPCVINTCALGQCMATLSTGSCDDGIACTVGDMCVNGVCKSGAWDASATCAHQTVDVWRSIGPGDALPIASGGSNALSLTGGVAHFGSPLPDRAGVGDVLQYDTDGDGTPDTIAFIHARTSATEYVVRDVAGAPPAPTKGDDVSWALYRAYTSLENAINMTANPSIIGSARPFEACPGDCDLAAKHRSVHLAAYAGQDDDRVFITGWNTDANDWLTVYAPTSPAEVGASQRHSGKWGDGYRRTQGIDINEPHVRLDGISTKVSIEDRVYLISLLAGRPGRVELSHCYGEMAFSPTWYRVYDFWGNAALTVTVTDSIAVDDSTESDSFAFYDNQADADAYLYDCTAIAAGGDAFRKDGGQVHIVGGIAVATGAAEAFSPTFDPAADTIDYSIASDATLASWTGQGDVSSQTPQFVDAANKDYHLASGDTVARGHGVDLSVDPNQPVTDDIDGDPRPTASSPDVGADQTK